MCGAGILLLLIASWAAKADIMQARGLDKIVALGNLCFAAPLAVFGAEHLSERKIHQAWRAFVYAMAFVLDVFRWLCVDLRVLEHRYKLQVRWSGLLFGIMMVLFVAIFHVPRALRVPKIGLHGQLFSAKCRSRAEAGILREKPCASTVADKAEASSSPWAACWSRSPLYFWG